MNLSGLTKPTVTCILLAPLLLAPLALVAAQAQEAPPHPWAYGAASQSSPILPAKPDDGTQRLVPDSAVSMTLTQTRDRFNAADWHPSSHPAMPEPVSHGRKPTTYACAFCHRAEGQGGAENANISGLDKAYITQQLEDMRAHKRQSAHDQRPSMVLKHQLTDTITDEEIAVSAAYFASLPARSWLKVVETDTVPRSGVYNNFFLIRMPGSNTEPLGERIIEVPDDADRFESRDTRTTFTAYVPRGSLERGQALATAGCLSCHGEGLKGGSGPRLAGQFATYLIRQLHDFQSGKRKGAQADQMAGVVEKLSVTDMIALAAYAASLSP